MTNVYGSLKKVQQRRGLFAFALEALTRAGWTVSRARGGGGASVREIRRGAEVYRVSIRTSQSAWIAFPRTSDDQGWVTLDDVDFVVAASVNRKKDPDKALVHLFPAKEVQARFDQTYKARRAAGYQIPIGRGVWLSLYDPDTTDPITHVGGGLGRVAAHRLEEIALKDLPIPDVLDGLEDEAEEEPDAAFDAAPAPAKPASIEPPLTIGEAKRRLALTLGVPETAIRITVEH